jgi:hypothetical protein
VAFGTTELIEKLSIVETIVPIVSHNAGVMALDHKKSCFFTGDLNSTRTRILVKHKLKSDFNTHDADSRIKSSAKSNQRGLFGAASERSIFIYW